MNTQQTTVLLALRTARPWYEGAWPKPHEVDAIVRRARKGLIEARNALSKERAHPQLVVAVFDQVSHALARFAVPSANGGFIVKEVASTANRAANAMPIATDERSSAIEGLIEDAACALVEVAAAEGNSNESSGAGNARQWLLNVAAELVRHARAPSTSATNTPAKQSQTVEEPVVKQNSPLIDTLKTDATDAAWRTAGSQFVKLTREPLVGLLTRHLAPGDEAFRAKIAAFLETELGGAIVASMLSAALSALPATAGEVPQKLARELRVRAISDAGDVMADLLMGPLRQVVSLYLQDPAGTAPAIPTLPQGANESFEDTLVRERVAANR